VLRRTIIPLTLSALKDAHAASRSTLPDAERPRRSAKPRPAPKR
jgi:hypothetical protein